MKKLRKLFTILLAVLVLISALPITAVSALGDYKLTLSTPLEITAGDTEATVTFKPEEDGWYKFYSTGDCDTYATLYNALGMELGYSDDIGTEYNFLLKAELSAGRTYRLEVGAYTYDATFAVCVDKTHIAESAVITKEPDTATVIKGYEYETMFFDGLEAEFTMTDGTKHIWTYEEENTIDGSYVNIDCGTDKDGNYYVEVICDEASARFLYTVVENPVDHIEYKDSAIEIIENTNGYYDDEYGIYYYYYDISEETEITIYYTDGTCATGSANGRNNEGFSYVYDLQHDAPWTVGSENFLTINYLGAETKIPVEILPTPIKNVTINSLPENTYIFGDPVFGYTDEGTYYLYPKKLAGINLTVEYKDGTTKTYTAEDFDEYAYQLDGYSYEISTVETKAPGTYRATMNYKGFDIQYEIEVISNPVKNIEFITDPDKTEYQGIYYPLLNGMEIKVTYTDGTSETVTLDDKVNVDYLYNAFLSYVITINDINIIVNMDFDEDGNEVYIFNCYDIKKTYTGFSFDYEDCIDKVTVENLRTDCSGTVLHITYTDGSEESLNLRLISCSTSPDDETYGAVNTKNGILSYGVIPENDGYLFHILDEAIFVENLTPDITTWYWGDANYDGEVNIKDATAIQKDLAKLASLPDTGAYLADVDGDMEITIKDATAIQKYIADIDTGLRVGKEAD